MPNWSTSDLADAYRRLGEPCPITAACGEGRSKYNAHRTVVDGITFDSGAEAHHWRALVIAEQAGAISQLERQPAFLLQAKFTDESGKKHRAITYRADFRFVRGGKVTVVDVKGYPTEAFKLKWKMALAKYPEITWELWK